MVPAAHGQVAVSFTYRGLSNGAPDVEIGMAQVVSGNPTYRSWITNDPFKLRFDYEGHSLRRPRRGVGVHRRLDLGVRAFGLRS
jgi:hypothetical protein